MWIRTASERDLPAVQKLLRETWHATYDAIYGVARVNEITSDWHSIDSLKRRLTKPHSEFIVCDGETGIIGMAFASQTEPGFVKLHQLYVHPSAQGQGAGSQMLNEIVEAFPEARTLRLEVEAANRQALGFYRSKGFSELSSTQNCGEDQSGIPALILEKAL
jgi:ribosomal protein S18 acetylase RimI-like enzyme